MAVADLTQYYSRFKPSQNKRANSKFSKLSLAGPHVPIPEPTIAIGEHKALNGQAQDTCLSLTVGMNSAS